MHVDDESFTHHCDTLPHGAQSSQYNYEHCKRNPGYEGFMTVPEFRKIFLHPYHQRFSDFQKDYIEVMIESTVKMEVSSTSWNRPDTYPGCNAPYPYKGIKGNQGLSRCGTGYLPYQDINKKEGNESCPCPECRTSGSSKNTYWEICATTATHVVFDKPEAERTVIELFYDSESRDCVRYLYGIDVRGDRSQRYNTDHCVLLCVTHDADLANTLTGMMKRRNAYRGIRAPTEILISHPHGVSKRISVGVVDQKCFLPNSKTLLSSLLQNNTEFSFWLDEPDFPLKYDDFFKIERFFSPESKGRKARSCLICCLQKVLYYKSSINLGDVLFLNDPSMQKTFDDFHYSDNIHISKRLHNVEKSIDNMDFEEYLDNTTILAELVNCSRVDHNKVFSFVKKIVSCQDSDLYKTVIDKQLNIHFEKMDLINYLHFHGTHGIPQNPILFKDSVWYKYKEMGDHSRIHCMDREILQYSPSFEVNERFKATIIDQSNIHFEERDYIDYFLVTHRIPHYSPSTILVLPGDTLVILPEEPKLELRRHFFGDMSFWGTISSGAKIIFTKGEVKVHTLKDILFRVPLEDEDKIRFDAASLISYSMPACPGSSGARVFPQHHCIQGDTDKDIFNQTHHFGCFQEQNFSGCVEEGSFCLSDIKDKRIKM